MYGDYAFSNKDMKEKTGKRILLLDDLFYKTIVFALAFRAILPFFEKLIACLPRW